ncbi:MAG: hypothetical protein FIB07_16330 [Candidatus Methanoperedens sp.]|nr:hypothetical protein [Candidatus Methanoperedens sp.]
MNKQVVIDIVKNIFANRGYSISSSEMCDLLAEKDTEHFLIKVEKDPNYNNMRYFSNMVKRYGKGIVISDSFDEKIRMLALNDGLILWDRGELEMQIGRMVLKEALNKHGETAENAYSIFSSSMIQEPMEVNELQTKEHLTKDENEKTIKVMLRCIPVNIGKKDALSIAEAKIGTPKIQTLKFIPVWYYSYSFNVQKKYKSKMVDLTGNGEGYIHAITGENFFNKYSDIRENIMTPTQNYEIMQPSIQKKEASEKAINSIIREHTKQVRLNEMIGDTIVFENRIFSPDSSEINLKINLLYVPVWEIKGKREVIDINGYDGHIMAIKLYNDAELV